MQLRMHLLLLCLQIGFIHRLSCRNVPESSKIILNRMGTDSGDQAQVQVQLQEIKLLSERRFQRQSRATTVSDTEKHGQNGFMQGTCTAEGF